MPSKKNMLMASNCLLGAGVPMFAISSLEIVRAFCDEAVFSTKTLFGDNHVWADMGVDSFVFFILIAATYYQAHQVKQSEQQGSEMRILMFLCLLTLTTPLFYAFHPAAMDGWEDTDSTYFQATVAELGLFVLVAAIIVANILPKLYTALNSPTAKGASGYNPHRFRNICIQLSFIAFATAIFSLAMTYGLSETLGLDFSFKEDFVNAEDFVPKLEVIGSECGMGAALTFSGIALRNDKVQERLTSFINDGNKARQF